MSLLTRTFKTVNVIRSSRGKSTDPVTYTDFYIKGSFQPITGSETFRDGKGGESATHRLYADVRTTLVYGDQVTHGGQTYVTLYAIQPSGISGRSHHKEYICGVFE
jgi:hypothetical protein